MDFNQTFELKDGIRKYNFVRCVLYLQLQARELYGSNYHIRPSQRTQLQKLLAYATADRDTCTFYGLDLSKGLLISGPENSGKTSLLHLLKPFFESERHYFIRSCREVVYCYDLFGKRSLQWYTDKELCYCYDDLGIVPRCINTKLDRSVVWELVKTRFVGSTADTHIITRLDTEALCKAYGRHFTALLFRNLNHIEFTESFNLI